VSFGVIESSNHPYFDTRGDYSGDRFPAWKGNLFLGGMRQGPGLLYVLTEEEDGALLRIEPAP
jgi:glucose/arabinose dehydrogenase